ncbi:MAG: hypothetical protein KKE51_15410 [Gammaproteobacteria bacterium]|nr:hypothetical protein [Gammaproteobacteria bacterium]MBU1603237.1 hypothetical protein [Gammaproteobacteria bacterium]MBU2432757.1 hypothetical protein [Gammaproteobacteria bacterium]MBU2451588.1 hypothetical protein [Gammaproteobacteria bacterium]
MNSIAIRPLPNQRQGRLMLALIVALLALPFIIGAGLYFGGWHPSRTGHHGHLLNPPRPLPEQMLRSTGKNSEKWKLVLQVSGPCAAECTNRLDEMRRIHVALYKNMGRLSRAVLTDQPDDPALLALHASQPDLMVLSTQPGALPEITDPVLLVDPQGLVIMTYPPDASPQGMRADLDRLLKYAWTG